jgi:2-haloacid dehalogenase
VADRPIIVFDFNETLLDLETIRPTFGRIFGDPSAMRLSFAGLVTYSEALTLAGVHVPFTDIGGAVLRMLAATRNISISDADAAELSDLFASMPPHPEVATALRRLADSGFRLFTLTDNTLEISVASCNRPTSSTCSSAASASKTRACTGTSRRRRPTAQSPTSCRSNPRTVAWSRATPGTRSAR